MERDGEVCWRPSGGARAGAMWRVACGCWAQDWQSTDERDEVTCGACAAVIEEVGE